MTLISNILFLSFKTEISDILNQWDRIGVFDYLLPFLLVFAVVYGILAKAKFLGNNKGVNAVIALAVGLLSLQFGFVTEFFGTIFPYAGLGISVILVALILIGLFAKEGDDDKTYRTIFIILGGIVALVVIFSALSNAGYTVGYEWRDSLPAIIAGMVIIGLIAWMIGAGGNSGKKKE